MEPIKDTNPSEWFWKEQVKVNALLPEIKRQLAGQVRTNERTNKEAA